MNICSIVRDLLPLYVEELISDENSEMVQQHLKNCDGCTNELEQLKKNLKIDTTTVNKKDKKILRRLKLWYNIPCYTAVTFMIFVSILINLNIIEILELSIIALIICGAIFRVTLKKIYILIGITVLLSVLIANHNYGLSYNIFGNTYITMFPPKALTIFICSNLFYILFGYFVAFMFETKKFKPVFTLLFSLILIFTTVPNNYYRNLWQRQMYKDLFESKVNSYNYYRNLDFKLSDFKYVKEAMSYLGYFTNPNGEKYKITSYGNGLGVTMNSEYDVKGNVNLFNQEKCLRDILVSNGLNFSDLNSLEIRASNKNGTRLINPYNPEYQIEFIDKYSIFTKHSNDTEIELQLSIKQYNIKDKSEFIQTAKYIVYTIKTLDLYWDKLIISDNNYKAEFLADTLNIDIE